MSSAVKILFSTRPAYGHVYALMPLALAARDAGHDVSIATTGSFLPKLAALGFSTHDVGITIEDARDRLLASLSTAEMPKEPDGRPNVEMGARLFADMIAPRTAADLEPVLARLEPDLVIYEQYELGAGVAAHAAGIPAVCHSLTQRLPDEVLGTSTAFDVFKGDAYLDIFPDALQQPSFLDHPARIPIRPVPFAEPGAPLPPWIGASGRPLVYVTLGTVVGTDDVLRPVIEGVGALDVDVLVALGSADGAELGSLPSNVHVERFVNQPAVLCHADLVVHHGGSGTTLGALSYGTSQVVLPKGADQFWNADAMTRAELAVVLEPAHVTPEAVACVAATELGNRRPAVEVMRAEIAAMPHPAEVLDQLARTSLEDWVPFVAPKIV